MAYWNDKPAIQYIVMLFMFLAGTNFVLSYFAFKGKLKRVWEDEEFKLYTTFVFGFATITSIIIIWQADVSISSINHPMVFGEYESAIRHGLFQVLTVMTTTGFVTADYTLWASSVTVIFSA